MGDADYTNRREHCLFCHPPNSGKLQIHNEVRFLRNKIIPYKLDGEAFQIIGLDPVYRPYIFLKSLPAAMDSLPTIVLSHSSLLYNKVSDTLHTLFLSGDTHGGQILLPDIFWRVSKRKRDYRHISGYFRDRNKHLIVSNGIGMSDVYMRIGVPPQLVLISFEKEERTE